MPRFLTFALIVQLLCPQIYFLVKVGQKIGDIPIEISPVLVIVGMIAVGSIGYAINLSRTLMAYPHRELQLRFLCLLSIAVLIFVLMTTDYIFPN